jgi:hypothetical protein
MGYSNRGENWIGSLSQKNLFKIPIAKPTSKRELPLEKESEGEITISAIRNV